MALLKRFVVGEPLATSEEQHQRLGRPTALAVFASDAISSTAYATEEILLVLVPLAGLAALTDLMPISFIVIVLLTLVITSYRQTIYAYPSGGGSYVVSRENLGETPSLVAGASLLVDYILTVAVSISAGVAAITSAFPELRPERVLLCLGFVALMMFANLRGLKESGPPVRRADVPLHDHDHRADRRRVDPLLDRQHRGPPAEHRGTERAHRQRRCCSPASRRWPSCGRSRRVRSP